MNSHIWKLRSGIANLHSRSLLEHKQFLFQGRGIGERLSEVHFLELKGHF